MLDIVIDEEISGHGTLDTVIRGYTADAGISGETSGLAVQPACIGRIWFEIEIQGQGGRHPTPLSGRQRHRARLQDHQGGRGARSQARRNRQASALSESD